MTRPLVVAHRGASQAVPPGNTIAAFTAARRLGADWVELDVRRTADGALAVHHDPHLADGRAIVELLAAELPDDVPLLDAALGACDGMGVNIEIKNAPGEPDWDEDRQVADAVVAVLAGMALDGVLITSFDPGSIARVRELAPELPTGLLAFDLSSPEQVVATAAAGGHQALNPWDHFVTAELVAQTHAAGLAVNVWTVDDPERLAELVAFGVDGIITNVPDRLRAILESG
ncbi:glycerophosphodiester phosphodiesterase [Rhabdothermincola sp.]|uniref:glycerophosphodiester phosphodiesterase n=1 Tax=Rhabdothermincola sp. TaxID=2820405 RepID=UPI002FE34D1C